MTSNAELIRKADIALADLAANGGLLFPEQSNRFIRKILDTPTIFSSARVVTMAGPQKKINKIGFGSRILRPAVSMTPLSAADRSKPETSNIMLNTTEVMAEVQIPYEVLEDNIEGGNINAPMGSSAGGLMGTIIDMIGERVAIDLEELGLLGDTTSTDNYLKLKDGWLKRADQHVVAATTSINRGVFKEAVLAMPPKYLRNRATVTHFLSYDNETEYRDQVAERTTAYGDATVQGASPLYVFGSPIVASAQMPHGNELYTDPLNLIFGVQRSINLEYDKDIRARSFIIVVTLRVDYQIEETDAIVRVNGIQ